MDDSEIGRSHSPVDQFEQNFSRLGLHYQPRQAAQQLPSFQPYPPLFALPQAAGFHAFRPPVLSKSQSIPNNLSDRINDIINKNESIVGRFNNRRNSASGSELLDPPEVNSAPVRKRAVRGPWRYEERILQLGYRPSSTASSTSSTSTASSQRRNSLPVQSTLQQQLTRDCPSSRPYAKKQKFKRRASLPVIQAPQSLIENMENGFIPHQAPPASKPRAIRASVIISNPAHRPQVTQASPNILPTTVAEESKSRSWDNLASINDDGADSDGSELIIVDDDQAVDTLQAAQWEVPKPSVITSGATS